MKKHIVSIGFHAVYNIEVKADTPEAAEKIVSDIYEEQGLKATLDLGEYLPPENKADVLIQYEGEK